jgi:hypothetical protein
MAKKKPTKRTAKPDRATGHRGTHSAQLGAAQRPQNPYQRSPSAGGLGGHLCSMFWSTGKSAVAFERPFCAKSVVATGMRFLRHYRKNWSLTSGSRKIERCDH